MVGSEVKEGSDTERMRQSDLRGGERGDDKRKREKGKEKAPDEMNKE